MFPLAREVVANLTSRSATEIIRVPPFPTGVLTRDEIAEPLSASACNDPPPGRASASPTALGCSGGVRSTTESPEGNAAATRPASLRVPHTWRVCATGSRLRCITTAGSPSTLLSRNWSHSPTRTMPDNRDTSNILSTGSRGPG